MKIKYEIEWHTFTPSAPRTHLEQGKLKTNLNYQPKSIFYAWISNQIICVTVWSCFWVLFSSRLRLRDWIESNPIKSWTTYFKTQSNAAGPNGAFTERIMPAEMLMCEYISKYALIHLPVSRIALSFWMIYSRGYVQCTFRLFILQLHALKCDFFPQWYDFLNVWMTCLRLNLSKYHNINKNKIKNLQMSK